MQKARCEIHGGGEKVKRICDGCGENFPELRVIYKIKPTIDEPEGEERGQFCSRCSLWWHKRIKPELGRVARPMPPVTLTEIGRDYYGGDDRAINKHSDRYYRTLNGQNFTLSRCTDAVPKYFEALGPFHDDFQGLTPRLTIEPETEKAFGSGITWSEAERLFFEAVRFELKGEEVPA